MFTVILRCTGGFACPRVCPWVNTHAPRLGLALAQALISPRMGL